MGIIRNQLLAAALVLLAGSHVYAASNTYDFTAGVDRGNRGSKIFALTFRQYLNSPYFFIAASGGVITEYNLLSQPIGFVEASFGTELRIPYVYLYVSQGIAALTQTAIGLPTNYQLPTTIGFGIHRNTIALGFAFKHFSNGQHNPKNTGRNFLCTELRITF